MASLIATLLSINIASSTQITGWVYADNWFQLYFNGVKVAQDPVYFYPHNAVYINFTAPDSGLYSFAFWAQDFANDTTGLEPRQNADGDFAGWCVGDGGIRMKLSDGTVTSSEWKCMVVHEGPVEETCKGECLAMNLNPSICTTTTNEYPSCWNEAECSAADSWTSATEISQDTMGWGRSPSSDIEKFDYTYPAVCSGLSATSTTEFYQENGCIPADQFRDDTTSTPIWTSDLDYDNRIICRYSYCVGGGTDCVSEGSPSSTTSTTAEGDATSSTSMPKSGANKVFGFMALVIMFIAMMI